MIKFKFSELFERNVEKVPNSYIKKIERLLNEDTLDNWSFSKTKKEIKENENFFYPYAFYVLKKWIMINQRFDEAFIHALITNIQHLNLENRLYPKEKEFILYFQNVIFAKNRNLKSLISSFSLLSHEKIYFRYEMDWLYIDDKKYFDNAEIYLSTHRFIISGESKYVSFMYKDIEQIKLTDFFLEIKWKNKIIKIVSGDLHLIYCSLERIFKLTKVKL